ncbi:Receptor-type guanylate cyclase gcy [Seminavis robusta]|uniref:Receptor-type guanylate cyclase gcy n=1 Tax=Seminavis robusta TaxID=568900 RepID=A0A9N8EUS3_9STRA|nr:Receptor-type guanylate cyclase gcy [Seminavis robusta]|eukprot:Sro1679_g290720.1 Receptor-type guanylate cyclase gcy (1375) ;mRNA; r:16846-22417
MTEEEKQDNQPPAATASSTTNQVIVTFDLRDSGKDDNYGLDDSSVGPRVAPPDIEEGALDPSDDDSELSALPRRWSDFSGLDSSGFDASFEDEHEHSSSLGNKKRRGAKKGVPDESMLVLSPRAVLARRVLMILYTCFVVLVSTICFLLAQGANECVQDDYAFPPIALALFIAMAFSLIGGVAYAYDTLLQQQLVNIHKAANQSRAIVTSLFPKQFHDQLYREAAKKQELGGLSRESFGSHSHSLDPFPATQHHATPGASFRHASKKKGDASERDTDDVPDLTSKSNKAFAPLPKARLKSFLDHEGDAMESGHFMQHARPIADLFPSATVLFADISGFTAWSSEREPVQVFYLLESLYKAFDRIARRFGVFKVETIGDCYMCVTGLPDPQPDHATRMVRFSRQMIKQGLEICKKLERTLGPDTGDLRLRVGMHSGPVTAGVLRGEKSRFQLFGDTVNTASRMESTGERHRIQLSQTTADLVIAAGKENWILPRPDLVEAKGKGDMQTYWAIHHSNRDARTANSVTGVSSVSGESMRSSLPSGEHGNGWDGPQEDENFILNLPTTSRSAKNARLVDWNVELLVQQLKRVEAQRSPNLAGKFVEDPMAVLKDKAETPYEEVVEAFQIPKFDDGHVFRDSMSVELDSKAVEQLHQVVTIIADKYRDNAFHSFEHASHVTMSVHKLLNRVVTPDEVDYQRDAVDAIGLDVHNYTYGITSDALSQFAIVFSALIHDVDHTGVSNPRLAEENPELGDKYKNRSIAEQNSVDIAWELLMQPQYKELQQAIFRSEEELLRFRSAVVNAVMATDIFEKDGKAFRNQRWEKAFRSKEAHEESSAFDDEQINLKATIVIEHIIQASDVSHTMQHWSIYQKWNEKLFREMYMAFDAGRAVSDPSKGWYKGELWFFDNYVIPLGKKLDECNVFGVSSDEYLNYAETNRKIWAQKGEEVVKEMVDRYQKRKELEIGGLTTDEINGFSAKDLEYIMKKLIEKGRNSGTKKVDAAKGQNDAAQAWMDALEIYQRAPSATEIKDRSIIFPVYSGIHPWLKGGKIFNDEEGFFEQNLARKFVREAKLYRKNPIHYYRALSMLSEVTAKIQDYSTAIKLSEFILTMYKQEKHSREFEKMYGVDRAATQFANTAVYHEHLGNHDKASQIIEYVLNTFLPGMDPTNTLGNFELMMPIIYVLHLRREDKRCYDVFNDEVESKFQKHHGPDAFTPTKSIHKPILWLFKIAHDLDGFDELDGVVEYFAEDDKGMPFPFLENIVVKTTWGPSQMFAELCLLAAKKLERENGDMEVRNKMLLKALKLTRMSDYNIRDKNGNVLLPIAHAHHQPIFDEIVALAKSVGIFEDEERQEPTPGVQVKLPQSYLVTPTPALEFLS